MTLRRRDAFGGIALAVVMSTCSGGYDGSAVLAGAGMAIATGVVARRAALPPP